MTIDTELFDFNFACNPLQDELGPALLPCIEGYWGTSYFKAVTGDHFTDLGAGSVGKVHGCFYAWDIGRQEGGNYEHFAAMPSRLNPGGSL